MQDEDLLIVLVSVLMKRLGVNKIEITDEEVHDITETNIGVGSTETGISIILGTAEEVDAFYNEVYPDGNAEINDKRDKDKSQVIEVDFTSATAENLEFLN